MFGKMGDLLGNIDNLKKLAGNDNFKHFLTNPKVQALMADESFKRAIAEKNMFKLMGHKGFMELLKDPEIRAALEEMNKNT